MTILYELKLGNDWYDHGLKGLRKSLKLSLYSINKIINIQSTSAENWFPINSIKSKLTALYFKCRHTIWRLACNNSFIGTFEPFGANWGGNRKTDVFIIFQFKIYESRGGHKKKLKKTEAIVSLSIKNTWASTNVDKCIERLSTDFHYTRRDIFVKILSHLAIKKLTQR